MSDGDSVAKGGGSTLAEDLLGNIKLEEGGQFEIGECILEAKGGIYDFSKDITSLHVWEHIFRVFITAEIVILDTHNILNGIEITGTEPVHLEFRTLGSAYPVSINMVVSHIKKKEKINEVTNKFTLALVSPDFLNNQRIKISTCYRKGPIEAVKDIFFKRLKSKEKLWVEENTNNNSIIIPNVSPTDAIELLSQFAKSNEGNVSYLFFQTTKSFHYRSYADMIKAKRQGVGSDPFNSGMKNPLIFEKGQDEPSPIKTPLEKCSRLLAFDVESDVDILKQTRLGTYASRVIEHDVWGKSIILTTLNYHKDAFNGDILKLGKFPITPDGPVEEGDDINLSSFKDSHVELISAARDSNYREYKLPAHESGITYLEYENKKNRMSEINSMFVQRAKIKVMGISGIQAGDVIGIKIFIPSGAEATSDDITGKTEDQKLSGNWLIESVAHSVTVGDKYYCIMYIIRDSVDLKQTDYTLLNYKSSDEEFYVGDENRVPEPDF